MKRSQAHDADIKKLRVEENLSLQQTADRLGISRATVRRSCIAQCLPLYTKPTPGVSKLDSRREAVELAYNQNTPLSDMCDAFSCDWATLRKFLKSHGLNTRKGWSRNRAGQSVQDMPADKVRYLADRYSTGDVTIRQLAAEAQMSSASVLKVLKNEGVPRRSAHTRKKTAEQRKNTKLLNTYGITHEQFKVMQDNCENRCQACGCDPLSKRNHGSSTLSIDHCHVSGQVRGLLCKNCNMALGLLANSPEIALSLSAYMQKWVSAATS
jgi:hypothetical protein